MDSFTLDISELETEFSFTKLRKRMDERLDKVRRINHPEEYENQRASVKENQNHR